MTTPIRKLVSKKKKRLKTAGFNLDMSYITSQIVTMGFPASKLEGMYRNKMTDVVKYLDQYHKDKYYIYNLCSEKDYDPDNFYGRVQKFPFEDHNPPPIELMMTFCKHAGKWLSQGEDYLVVVHCKAGKGRSGVMACCLMIYLGIVSTARESLDFYGNQRTKNGKGVTIPSQRRYVGYFEKIHKNGLKPPYVAKLQAITLGPLKKIEFSAKRDKKSPMIEIYDIKWKKIFTSKKAYIDFYIDENNYLICNFKAPFPCVGDVRIAFYNQNEHLFNLWFNSAYIQNKQIATNKFGLDKLVKNKSIKSFSVKVEFEEISKNVENKNLYDNILTEKEIKQKVKEKKNSEKKLKKLKNKSKNLDLDQKSSSTRKSSVSENSMDNESKNLGLNNKEIKIGNEKKSSNQKNTNFTTYSKNNNTQRAKTNYNTKPTHGQPNKNQITSIRKSSNNGINPLLNRRYNNNFQNHESKSPNNTKMINQPKKSFGNNKLN
ncbi:phosphatase with homology to tensin [Anaeramoeba flamelloides]|uniref:Phosphatidylinositol 3,4,5-trisphosphate 3-phosphatase and dual-specificity protein phosphatase PTEN n=1 Tax=Anaeramoeba flamelloides TaxID=1746091 RepID=A0ABQ8YR90_9EUKA|nr:phosphatase with homology to tensin [Anaeramoeba flamelloides]